MHIPTSTDMHTCSQAELIHFENELQDILGSVGDSDAKYVLRSSCTRSPRVSTVCPPIRLAELTERQREAEEADEEKGAALTEVESTFKKVRQSQPSAIYQSR
jgi:hypothetical protein